MAEPSKNSHVGTFAYAGYQTFMEKYRVKDLAGEEPVFVTAKKRDEIPRLVPDQIEDMMPEYDNDAEEQKNPIYDGMNRDDFGSQDKSMRSIAAALMYPKSRLQRQQWQGHQDNIRYYHQVMNESNASAS